MLPPNINPKTSSERESLDSLLAAPASSAVQVASTPTPVSDSDSTPSAGKSTPVNATVPNDTGENFDPSTRDQSNPPVTRQYASSYTRSTMSIANIANDPRADPTRRSTGGSESTEKGASGSTEDSNRLAKGESSTYRPGDTSSEHFRSGSRGDNGPAGASESAGYDYGTTGGVSGLPEESMSTSRYARNPNDTAIPSRTSGPASTATPSHQGLGPSEARINLDNGLFAGKTMRLSLAVEQQPIHGRRKTDKDRRPLAHSPILRLRLAECTYTGTHDPSTGGEDEWEEVPTDLQKIETGNLVCAATLAAPRDDIKQRGDHPIGAGHNDGNIGSTDRMDISSPPRGLEDSTVAGTSPSEPKSPQASNVDPYRPSWITQAAAGPSRPPGSSLRYSQMQEDDEMVEEEVVDSGRNGAASHSTVEAAERPASAQTKNRLQRTAGSRSSGSSIEDDHRAEGGTRGDPKSSGDEQRRSHTSKKSRQASESGLRNLYGSLHEPGIRVIAPDGDMGLWFLFTDLAVRQEGLYSLVFKVYDITSLDSTNRRPVPSLVEAYSQNFRVYSPRNFPGLPKPTELAEHFAKQGFKLNTRKNERLARSPPASASASSSSNPMPPPSHPAQPASRGRGAFSQKYPSQQRFSRQSQSSSSSPVASTRPTSSATKPRSSNSNPSTSTAARAPSSDTRNSEARPDAHPIQPHAIDFADYGAGPSRAREDVGEASYASNSSTSIDTAGTGGSYSTLSMDSSSGWLSGLELRADGRGNAGSGSMGSMGSASMGSYGSMGSGSKGSVGALSKGVQRIMNQGDSSAGDTPDPLSASNTKEMEDLAEQR